MSSIHIPQKNAFFLHIPKTAGYSISSALLEAFPDAIKQNTRGLRRLRGAARDMSRRYHARFLEETFSFAFVRNPWDWTVSGWKHVTKNAPAYAAPPPSFEDFVTGDWTQGLANNPNKGKFATARIFVAYHTQITQWDHLEIGLWPGRQAPLAMIGRFETLESDLARVFEVLGREAPLPHKNVSGGDPYTVLYTPRLKDIVWKKNRKLIERFRYEFET